MSWSYSGDPSSSPLDEVRFLTGDTQQDDQFLSNEEILYNIKMVYGNNPPASGNFLPAAYCADLLVARYSRAADETVGDVSVSYSQRFKNFTDLAGQLRRRATFAGVPVYVGGISLADKAANDTNPDNPQLAFKIDGMNNKSSGNITGGDPNVGP